jgi:hypothetical protein
MGIYEEALAVLAPELSQFSTRDVLLRAALAGAMTGKGYPGQAAFTNQFIVWNREIYTRPEVVATAATDLTSIQLSALKAIASWVARGKEQAQVQLYFERARALDPEDAVVEYELGGLYSGALRLEDAKAAYEIAAEHGTGEIRMLAELDLQWLDGQIKAMARADSHLVKPP